MEAKQYVKDGEWFRLYSDDIGTCTSQHSELFDGKIEIHPDWEISDEEIGRVYIINKKKICNENNSKNINT